MKIIKFVATKEEIENVDTMVNVVSRARNKSEAPAAVTGAGPKKVDIVLDKAIVTACIVALTVALLFVQSVF